MKLLRDIWLIFGRYFGIFLRNPAWVAIGVAQPALYLLLFAPLLKSVASVPGFPSGGPTTFLCRVCWCNSPCLAPPVWALG
jgi:hypothetical protein